MKKTSIIMLTFLLVAVFMNVGNISVEAKADYLLKLSTQLNESDPLVDGFKEFKKNVEERTDGNLLIEIYPSAQLGSDEDVIEQTRMGVNVALLTDGGRMANYVKDIGVIGMPYIVDNYDEILDLVNTQSFKEWEEELANNHGLQVLAFNWYHGPRHFLTNEPVRKPEDLNGVRVRTPGAPVWQESIKAMGATPVALGWTEVYTAMQQDVIDGAEAQHLASYNSRLYEVINYINKTSHFQLINGIVVGDKWFNSLPEEYQNIVLEEAKKAGENTARKVIKLADDYEDRMVEEGMKVIDSDTEAFKNAAQQAYKELEFIDLKEKLYEEMNK